MGRCVVAFASLRLKEKEGKRERGTRNPAMVSARGARSWRGIRILKELRPCRGRGVATGARAESLGADTGSRSAGRRSFGGPPVSPPGAVRQLFQCPEAAARMRVNDGDSVEQHHRPFTQSSSASVKG